MTIHHQPAANPQDNNLVAGGDKRDDATKEEIHSRQTNACIDLIWKKIKPVIDSQVSHPLNFNRRDTVQGFHKIRIKACFLD